MIHPIKLRLSNAYLVIGEFPVLVDTGAPGDAATLRKFFSEQSLDLADLRLIVHTHVHSDHMGSTLELTRRQNIPVTFHQADQRLADRGDNGRLHGIGLRGKMMSPLFSGAKFAPVPADFFSEDGMRLDEYGISARVVHTPGHTAGSLSVIMDDGDAIIGDVIMGGYLGGQFLATRPNWHYFAEDFQTNQRSLDRLLAETSGKLYVGHGGPVSQERVKRWRQRASK